MRVIIAGTRTFNDVEFLKKQMYYAFRNDYISEIVSGCAKGADLLGEEWAKERNIPVKRFPADWAKHGKAAGPMRNEEMAKNADACIVFWDGESKGTKNMIDNAKKQNLKLFVIYYKDELAFN